MRSTRAFKVVFPLVLAIFGCVSGCSNDGGKTAGTPKNVILVTLDTTRPDFFGAWGRAGDPTPNFDSLAKDGVRFAEAVSSSALTPVSHASILTGRAPYGHRLRILAGPSGFQLPEEVPTLGSVLKERGFATAAFHSSFPVSAIYGFGKGFDVFEDVAGTGLVPNKDGSMKWDVTKGQRRSDTTTSMVLDFVEKTTEPFFIWIHYWDPHDPYMMPPNEYMQEKGVPFGPNGPDMQSIERYAAEISYVDKQFGTIMDTLKEKGLYSDTLFAVVADHGEGLDDGYRRHGWGAHRILYQEQIHVPLIMRVPGASSSLDVTQLVRSVDIFPTVLDYLDIAPPGQLEGRSLRDLIESDPNPEPRIAYADQINLWDANAKMLERRPKADFIHVLMTDEYKLIYRPSYPRDSELYEIRKDPDEMKNIFGDPTKRGIVVSMLEDLARRDPWVLRPYTAEEGGGMSQHDMDMLGNLGYAEGGDASTIDASGMWEWLCPKEWKRLESSGPCSSCSTLTVPVRKAPPVSTEK